MTDGTERTPLQKLDDAIRQFLIDVGDEDTLSGWILAYQTSYIADTGPEIQPLGWSGDYSTSPGLSPFAAHGLTTYLQRIIENVFREMDQA